MTDEEFRNLETGDVVRHDASSKSAVVTANYGGRVTAVNSYDLTNPGEWKLISKLFKTERKKA